MCNFKKINEWYIVQLNKYQTSNILYSIMLQSNKNKQTTNKQFFTNLEVNIYRNVSSAVTKGHLEVSEMQNVQNVSHMFV